MDWLGLNDNKNDGIVYIEIDQFDILQALDDALLEIYLCYEEAKVIYLKVNDIGLMFNKSANPQDSVFHVFGGKWYAEYDVFLKSSISLGEISTDEWTDFVSFYTYLTPYLEGWMETLHKYIIHNNLIVMTKEMSYNSLVLFETPTLLDDTLTYGLAFNKQAIMDYISNISNPMTLEQYIGDYVQYIVGASEWLKSGNDISEDKQFFIKCSKNYYVNDYYVKKFCKKVYEDNPLRYKIIEECNPVYSKDEMDDNFIISEEAYNRFKNEYGKE